MQLDTCFSNLTAAKTLSFGNSALACSRIAEAICAVVASTGSRSFPLASTVLHVSITPITWCRSELIQVRPSNEVYHGKNKRQELSRVRIFVSGVKFNPITLLLQK